MRASRIQLEINHAPMPAKERDETGVDMESYCEAAGSLVIKQASALLATARIVQSNKVVPEPTGNE